MVPNGGCINQVKTIPSKVLNNSFVKIGSFPSNGLSTIGIPRYADLETPCYYMTGGQWFIFRLERDRLPFDRKGPSHPHFLQVLQMYQSIPLVLLYLLHFLNV